MVTGLFRIIVKIATLMRFICHCVSIIPQWPNSILLPSIPAEVACGLRPPEMWTRELYKFSNGASSVATSNTSYIEDLRRFDIDSQGQSRKQQLKSHLLSVWLALLSNVKRCSVPLVLPINLLFLLHKWWQKLTNPSTPGTRPEMFANSTDDHHW